MRFSFSQTVATAAGAGIESRNIIYNPHEIFNLNASDCKKCEQRKQTYIKYMYKYFPRSLVASLKNFFHSVLCPMKQVLTWHQTQFSFSAVCVLRIFPFY